jgi:predicted transcriptional regulator
LGRQRQRQQLENKSTASKTIGATIEIEMPATHSRDRMIEALRKLPQDATVDDAIERLVFLAKIEAGLGELDRGEGIPHDEVRRRLGV